MKFDKNININDIIRTILFRNVQKILHPTMDNVKQQCVLEDALIEMLDNLVHVMWSMTGHLCKNANDFQAISFA